jgi:branched-chain amino acid transport system permease protein
VTVFGYSLANLPTQLEPAKYERMIFGIILVLMMIFRPQGILPARRRQRELAAPHAAEPAEPAEASAK